MKREKSNLKNRGSATLITLFITTIILTLSLSFNWYVREYLKNVEAFKQKIEAMLISYSNFDLLCYLITTGSFTYREIQLPSIPKLELSFKHIPLDGTPFILADKDLIIKVYDSNGLITLNPVNEDGLLRVLKKYGVRSPEAFLERYYDWIDTDNFRRLYGAERQDYLAEGYEYGPRNYPLQYEEEFMLIKGFSYELTKNILPYLTLLPGSGFNPNTSPPEVLEIVLNIDETAVKQIVQYRTKIKPITSDEELYSLAGKPVFPGVEYDFKPSKFLKILMKYQKETTVYELKVGLKAVPSQNTPFEILQWKED